MLTDCPEACGRFAALAAVGDSAELADCHIATGRPAARGRALLQKSVGTNHIILRCTHFFRHAGSPAALETILGPD